MLIISSIKYLTFTHPPGALPPSPDELRMSVEQKTDIPRGHASPAPPRPDPAPHPRGHHAPHLAASHDTEDFVMVPASLPAEPEAARHPGCVLRTLVL